MTYKFQKGFTLIEILVVIAIMGILFVVVLPSFQAIKEKNLLKATVARVSSVLDKARSQSLSSVDSSEYGVHFQSDKIVIFKGASYSSSNPDNVDVLISSPAFISDISLSGGADDLYFDRLSGAPDKTGTITISVSSSSSIITISPTGAVGSN